MKQDLIATGIAAARIAYLVSVFTTDMITEKENVELNNWLENNPENCAIFDAMTLVPIHDFSNTENCHDRQFSTSFLTAILSS